jgi:hypothetical protein
MSILITGACGLIGRKLRRYLEDTGRYELRLIDARPRGDPAVIAADLSHWDESWVERFRGVTSVVHLAADARPWASADSVQRNNIDATQNVFSASVQHGVRRVVFASSTWAMAGYRYRRGMLSTQLPPRPTNPYGRSKVAGERIAEQFSLSHNISVVSLRIGHCNARLDDTPGPRMGGRWAQEKWISDRDLCHLIERAILAEGICFAIVNAVSDNPGMRWDIDAARRLLGYSPLDGHRAVVTPMSWIRDAAEFLRLLQRRLLQPAPGR